jgi:CubicO group peptidase (beta-lactamase class C family)
MGIGSGSVPILLVSAAMAGGPASAAGEPRGLDRALGELSRQGRFSGAVVVRGPQGVRFARGYGAADPFMGVPFTPDTPVDSGSLAKPVTAAAVLLLARDGKVDLNAPVVRYLPEYPHAGTTVRHLLAHSAGLALDETPEGLAGKDNAALLAEAGGRAPLFRPGTAFAYCNLCYVALAMLIERIGGAPYLGFVQRRTALPSGVSLRPRKLADWRGRAVGYRRTPDGTLERFDSWEGEAFYGAGNLSLSAAQLAQWGSEWWTPRMAAIRSEATRPAIVAGKRSGLSWGNWYCSPQRHRCHYLGHHEGFHHMLYWDAKQRVSVAMVSNNGLAPAFHQSLQRALVAFAENRPAAARRELEQPLPALEAPSGAFRLCSGGTLTVRKAGSAVSVERDGLSYPAYPTGSPVRYVPGLDGYLAGDAAGRVHWISLYDGTQPRCQEGGKRQARVLGRAAASPP